MPTRRCRGASCSNVQGGSNDQDHQTQVCPCRRYWRGRRRSHGDCSTGHWRVYLHWRWIGSIGSYDNRVSQSAFFFEFFSDTGNSRSFLTYGNIDTEYRLAFFVKLWERDPICGLRRPYTVRIRETKEQQRTRGLCLKCGRLTSQQSNGVSTFSCCRETHCAPRSLKHGTLARVSDGGHLQRPLERLAVTLVIKPFSHPMDAVG